MSVGEICNREVVIVEQQTTISEAAKLMRGTHVGDVVVVEARGGQQVPVGILTDRDIVVQILGEDVDPQSVAVKDVMSFDLQIARESDDVLDAIKTMRSAGVRRMPVVDAQGMLVGILSADDALELIAEQLADLVGLVKNEQRRERRKID